MTRMRSTTVVCCMFLLALVVAAPARCQSPEGFGQSVTGGAGHPIVLVTTLQDSSPGDPLIPGSLREALMGGNRRIHFAVGGEIRLRGRLELRARSNVTVDGATAPPPGITLRFDQLEIRDSSNIIIRHIRSRDTADTGDNVPAFMIYKNCSNIWLDHLSISRASDESIGVYGGALGEGRPTNVTLSWNLIADADDLVNANAGKGILVSGPGSGPPGTTVTGEFADRVSIHHNILTNNHQRNPQVAGNGGSGVDEPRVDFRNNIVHDWYNYGMRLRWSATGNVVKNIFLSAINPEDAVVLELPGPFFMSGNVAPPQGSSGADINSMGTSATPIAAPAVVEQDVQTLPALLLGDGVATGAGALPRDAYDQAVVARLQSDLSVLMPECADLGGEGCGSGQACQGGSFVASSDYGSLCCVGGSCATPGLPSDSDGDGVEGSADNCPAVYNPSQLNSDSDTEGGDACDITVVSPLDGEVTCDDPPPLIRWSPEIYSEFKVFIGARANFKPKVTSGKHWLIGTTTWVVPAAKWLTICGKGTLQLFIKVKGRNRATRQVEFSEAQAITVR